MRAVLTLVLAISAVISTAAQSQTRPSQWSMVTDTVVADTEFPVRVVRTIKAADARIGDVVEFRTVTAVLIGHGFVVPDGTRLLGKVIAASAAAPGRVSVLRFSADTLVCKDKTIALNAVLVRPIRLKLATLNGRDLVLPSNLEGVHVEFTTGPSAVTSLSTPRDFVLRRGTMFFLRHLGSVTPNTRTDDTLRAEN